MRRASLIAVSIVLATLIPSQAHAADGALVAAGLQFAPGTVVLPEGSGLLFANADPVAAAFGNGHNVVHDVAASQRKFSAPTIGIGQTASVSGVASLRPGTYAFLCTVHPALMKGTLRIVEA